jgi:hypothetical protein
MVTVKEEDTLGDIKPKEKVPVAKRPTKVSVVKGRQCSRSHD